MILASCGALTIGANLLIDSAIEMCADDEATRLLTYLLARRLLQ